MIKAKLNTMILLDIPLCETIYNKFRENHAKYPGTMGEPLPLFNLRFSGVLESIIESARLISDLLSHDIVEIAVTYLVHLAKSQAFSNGNKRMAVVFTNLFLLLNGYDMTKTWFDLGKLVYLISENHSSRTEEIEKELVQIFRKIIIKTS